MNLRSPETKAVAVKLASLGLSRVRETQPLTVRQREEVRRALAEAGECAGWPDIAVHLDDPVSDASADLKKIVRSGVRALEKELENEVAEKKKEAKRLQKVAAEVRKLAESSDVEYPAEIVFTRTVKSPSEGLITATETISMADSSEALKKADEVEKSLPRWVELRDQMLEQLKQKKANLELLGGTVSEVVESWRGLLKELLVNMT